MKKQSSNGKKIIIILIYSPNYRTWKCNCDRDRAARQEKEKKRHSNEKEGKLPICWWYDFIYGKP